MNGILLVDKPSGWSSFDVVGKVRGLITRSALNTTNKKRFPVGHIGTLDPLATGLLVLLVGNYTKRAPALTKLNKTYVVTMKLGQKSTTGDEEGEKSEVSDRKPAESEIIQAFSMYIGEILQVPPIYSAIKINGQRAYKLARENKAVVMEPRKVTIQSISLQNYTYPFVTFITDVSSGTYIRSLVEDLGNELATGAYMSDLRRTKVGTFDLKNALVASDLTLESIQLHIRE